MALSITVTELAAVKVKGCQQCARFEEKKYKSNKQKLSVHATYLLHKSIRNKIENCIGSKISLKRIKSKKQSFKFLS